jgi:hypothetical protein
MKMSSKLIIAFMGVCVALAALAFAAVAWL